MKHAFYQSDVSKQPVAQLRDRFCADISESEALRIEQALELAVRARDIDTLERPRGIDAADILLALKVDAQTLESALLSDPWLRDNLGTHEIRDRFGAQVAELVEKINWLNTFNEYPESEIQAPEQAELLRRMLLAVVNDVRAVLVKLAYRVQRLRMLKNQEDIIRYRIARETLDLFAPLANRLGLGQLKWELEDLSFRYIEPEEYRSLAKSLATNRAERESYVSSFILTLSDALKQNDIAATVYGRPKHIYSIWRKMQNKQVPVDELYDLLAVRVTVDKPATCYAVLGLVHSLWLHVPKEFDDYIANPKENGYQSLHTVVIGPEGRHVEIQIRTQEMHMFAEYGVAAHWRYKEGSKQDAALDRSINSLRRLLESRSNDQELLDDFHTELFADQIFVLTPKGQVIRLRKGATPVDFAYSIHSEVGHRCRGAKVNGQIVPLTYTLKSGEKVEIITAKHGAPSFGWLDPHLGYIATPNARSKIRQWFKQQDHEKFLRLGKALLDSERHKLHQPALKEAELNRLARHFHLPRADDLLLAIGRAEIGAEQLASALGKAEEAPPAVKAVTASARKVRNHDKLSARINVSGVGNLLTHLAQCCNPVPGAPIIGYVTIGHSISVHRQDCSNIEQLPPHRRDRLVEVSWGNGETQFQVQIEVSAIDRKGLLKDVTHVLALENANILQIHTNTSPLDQSVTMLITVELQHQRQLDDAIGKISNISNVLSVQTRN
ncbi:bifunctional (p)ppGpp synthetase/guanosine-3',5'-bis(diphosphate) 3'-pyrophosphohydrolase [Candidatus Methylospira mobilis]|uniref:GTP pyrophosphokinase n=1 Tax=Candidatus Methylospira mobilis TaxID=1808979 RepID=A0A5Q0BIT6_9GAMM|nr:bifunctional (p)ppGpp synthetase/guanosine-3',5'-bis(diphosphate) 3'-pyrophosphohydrolase [Candidatus Methylospira mobilis]QFY43479.1 bifunctional (p)ppGpp synthetase/guanosine-3',5'-bis(diphosphate) 3'-pyrophosphohydrolase [Candidatus Methylospira mobilis]WNV03979.1 bifunctional (p)ppGpp synthetase/guanosine-3',5'-bis(diphosphate) 3'-pyrophosphohydrolase [Candidatus Methylospira mobilis]